MRICKSIISWVAIGLMLAIGGCGSSGAAPESRARAPEAGEEKNKPRKVSVIKIEPQAFNSVIEASGTALPARESFLSLTVPGVIRKILVKRGERVKKGQALLGLDRSGFALGVEQAQAALDAAQVGFGSLETQKKRFDRLLAVKAVPRANYDKVKAQYDGTAATLAMAEVGLKMARKALADSELRAPYDGVITMLLKQVGEYAPAMPPTMLMKIVDNSSLDVQVFLPEVEAAYAHPGQEAEVHVDSADLTRRARVVFVSARIEPGSQTFEVRLTLDNQDGKIKAGAFSRVRINRRQSDSALLVPLRAVVRKDDQIWVYTVQEGKAVKTTVELGETSGDRALVLRGLAPGAEVVTSSLDRLQPGDAVLAEKS
ncbi:MAG TPA: efflux RND transporter periplasmic adaptor subunit [Myxococcota bacterium]|nr:efflux RND transporter periplasmic adaptor subunit [Myxococcota bacterium]